jgi:hypothetical protein
MNVQVFNEVNMPKLKGTFKGCKITFSKQGRISLNYRVVEIMGLIAGDKVEICQDLDNPSDWYLRKSDNGFTLMRNRTNERMKSLLFYHKQFVKMIVEHLGYEEGETYSFMVSPNYTEVEGVRMYPILFSALY